MKCDSCGHHFPSHEAAEETRNEATGPAYVTGQNTETVRMTLCPQCAAVREETKAFIFWPIVIFGAIIVLTILGTILNYFAP
jgi:hypothetical protein